MARKVERVAALAREAGVTGVVLSMQHNFAWITAGRSNRIDAARETGSASLLIAADGRRFVLTNTIEASRISAETVAGLDFEPITYSWTDGRANPSLPLRCAERTLGSGALGADTVGHGAELVEPQLTRLGRPAMSMSSHDTGNSRQPAAVRSGRSRAAPRRDRATSTSPAPSPPPSSRRTSVQRSCWSRATSASPCIGSRCRTCWCSRRARA